MSFFYDSCRLGGVLEGAWSAFFGVFWRFGGVLEPSWKCVLAFWRRREESLAPLGELEASCRAANDCDAAWRRLVGVLKAS